MNKANRELLSEVVKDRLEETLRYEAGSDESKASLKEAMDAADRQIELAKIEASIQEQIRTEEQRRRADRNTVILKCVEIGALVILTPLVDYGCKKAFAKLICNFEKDYNFTTSAGRALSSLFRFKK